jgi:hypothetical protein
MEFESRKSLLYLVFLSSAFVVSVYLVRGYAGVASPRILAAGLPVMAYLLSRFTGGSDGEVVWRGYEIADRRVMVMMGVFNLAFALTFFPLAYVGLFDDYTSVVDVAVQSISVIALISVALLLARPYGIKIEEDAQKLVSKVQT